MCFDLSGFKYEPHCEPLKRLVYVFATDEVISEYESKYRQGEKLFNNYKQLNDKTSLEWFCSDELIKLYELWDCKNKCEKMVRVMANTPEAKLARAMANTPEAKMARAMDKARGRANPQLKILQSVAKTTMDKLLTREEKNLKLYEKAIQKSQPIIERIAIPKPAMDYLPEAVRGYEANREAIKSLQNDPLSDLIKAQALHNSTITNAYINTAETALKALGGHSALRDKIAGIKPYQSELDRILSRGVNALEARALYGIQSEVLERFRNLKPPKTDEKDWEREAKEKDKKIEEIKQDHAKELEEIDKAHSKKLNELEKESRIMLLAMANGANQDVPRIEPNWEAGRPIDTEPACFITFALEAYWHSKDGDEKKRKKVPDDKELKRWLNANKDNNFEITIIGGYFIKINTKGYHIDNTASKKTVSFKSFTKSFDTVLTKIIENAPSQ